MGDGRKQNVLFKGVDTGWAGGILSEERYMGGKQGERGGRG